jgi:hypothetical protein
MPDDNGARLQRTRTGCQTCRKRRVKCDERQDSCTNCERLELKCPGYGNLSSPRRPIDSVERPGCPYSSSSASDITQAGIRRRRIRQSCNPCRAAKLKCNGQLPCQRCTIRRSTCRYTESAVWPGSENSGGRHASPTPQRGSWVTGAKAGDASLEWLQSPELPGIDRVKTLVDHYFSYIHPLRSFGFIHKPTFLQQIDSRDLSHSKHNALLHIICALGAKFVTLDHSHRNPRDVRSLGSAWAGIAKVALLSNLDSISVENLMTAILLQDYSTRQGDYSLAFMLTGVTTRMSQALQLNLEYSADILCESEGNSSLPSCTTKESRRRLMFSCYVADATVGSGVDQLTLLNEKDIKIQLPCDERLFLIQQPCITETLESGRLLSFIDTSSVPNDPVSNMGLQAHYIRLTAIRKRLLAYVKRLSTASPPWLPSSEFTLLDDECIAWFAGLPSSLRFNAANLYIRAETGELGSLCSLHATYHLTVIDLYRIFVPTLYRLRGAFSFPVEQGDFVRHHQSAIHYHARKLAEIAREAYARKGLPALADFWWPTVLFESCRHMIYYEAKLSLAAQYRLQTDTAEMVKGNIELLYKLQYLTAMSEPLYARAARLLESCHSEYSAGPDDLESSPSAPGTPTQTAPDYVLHPLSIYRMARKTIPEKHAPEKTSPAATHTSPDLATAQVYHGDPQGSEAGISGLRRDTDTRTTHNLNQPVGIIPGYQQLADSSELDLFFPPGFSTAWQPAETMADTADAVEMPPWIVMPDQSAYGFGSWFANG